MSSWVQPEATSWKAPQSFRSRVVRAVSTPLAVGFVLFLAAVIGAIVFAVSSSHSAVLSASGVDQSAAVAPLGEQSALGEHSGSGGQGGLGEPAGSNESPEGSAGRQTDDRPGLLVHVVGEVQQPGIVDVDEGARVFDVIEAAGGATELAVLDRVNLARAVADGEQIIVPNVENADQVVAAESSSGGESDGVVSLNAATAEEFETLPGIGPAIAERIVSWRDTYGSFTQIEQLLEVSGIGVRKFEGLQDSVRL